MHVCRLCVEGADVLPVGAVCVEALTNSKAANRALSIHGSKQPLAEDRARTMRSHVCLAPSEAFLYLLQLSGGVRLLVKHATALCHTVEAADVAAVFVDALTHTAAANKALLSFAAKHHAVMVAAAVYVNGYPVHGY